MHSFEPEILQLRRAHAVTPAAARQALEVESRRLFSLRRELRAILYLGIAAVITGVGLVVKANLDRLGPLTLILLLGAAALACYLPAIRDHRAGRVRRLPADLLLLLAALLVSANLGYAEHEFHLLGDSWSRHLLLLAVLHGATAYLLGSRLVLSVALTSFAAWMGAETAFSFFFPFSRAHLQGTGWRSLGCAAVFIGWRVLHTRLLPRHRDFSAVFEGFAVHLAGVGALLLTLPGYYDRPMPTAALAIGVTVLAVVVLLIGGIGWQRRQESFVLAAIAYAVVGFLRLQFQFLSDPLWLTTSALVTVIAATALLMKIHARLKDVP